MFRAGLPLAQEVLSDHGDAHGLLLRWNGAFLTYFINGRTRWQMRASLSQEGFVGSLPSIGEHRHQEGDLKNHSFCSQKILIQGGIQRAVDFVLVPWLPSDLVKTTKVDLILALCTWAGY
jgi:hypothetical protein